MPSDELTAALETAEKTTNEITTFVEKDIYRQANIGRMNAYSVRPLRTVLNSFVAAAILEAQADAITPYCECLKFEKNVCPACVKVDALRAAEKAARHG